MRDIHCHILYGVDDGAKSRDESIAMLKAAKKCGVDSIVATPHYRNRWKKRQEALEAYKDLKPVARELGIELEFGCEFSVFEFERERVAEYRESFCLGDSHSFLLELGYGSLIRDTEEIICSLQRGGMEVILAHPERITEFQTQKAVRLLYEQLGCSFQVSADALNDPRLSIRRRTAERMIKQGKCDYIASDAHSVEDYALYAKAIAKLI